MAFDFNDLAAHFSDNMFKHKQNVNTFTIDQLDVYILFVLANKPNVKGYINI